MRLTDDEVRRLLDEATPGPWEDSSGAVVARRETLSGYRSVAHIAMAAGNDSPLIASAPDLAADLLDARKRIAELEEELEVEQWRCTRCGCDEWSRPVLSVDPEVVLADYIYCRDCCTHHPIPGALTEDR